MIFVAGLKTRASKAGVISPGLNWPSAPPLPAEGQVECLRAASPKLISPALICSSSCSAWPRSFTRMCAAEAERLISTSSKA